MQDLSSMTLSARLETSRSFRATEPDRKPNPWKIRFLIGQDAFETSATNPVPDRGDAPER